MKLRVLIVDDEPLGRASLRMLLERDERVELSGECANGKQALAAMDRGSIDLVFLDVQMPGLTGFDVLETLPRDKHPMVIFVTAYEDFALRAFEVQAIDYLVKPFDNERFQRALERALELFRSDAERETSEADNEDSEYCQRISISREGSMEMLPIEELIWIEAADQYVNLHSSRGEHLMRDSMTHFEKVLDPSRFLRVHRSAIVRLSAIRKLDSLPGGGGQARLEGGQEVPVSRSRMPVLRRKLAGRE